MEGENVLPTFASLVVSASCITSSVLFGPDNAVSGKIDPMYTPTASSTPATVTAPSATTSATPATVTPPSSILATITPPSSMLAMVTAPSAIPADGSTASATAVLAVSGHAAPEKAAPGNIAPGSSPEAGSTKRLPDQVPLHLYMPENPPAPGKGQAENHKLPYVLGQRSTNYNHASPTQAKNIELVAKRLNGTVLQPGQVFSYNRKLGPYTEQNGYGWGRAFSGNRIIPSLGGGVCQGASTLYSALLRTGAVTFVERHQHSLTVPYLPAGEDATVSFSSHLDFRFKNSSETPIMIGAEAYPEKRVITIAIWGADKAPEIAVRHQILAVYPYQTVTVRKSHSRGNTTSTDPSKPVAPGQVGCKVYSWLEIKTSEGVVKKPLGTDTYKPSPRIIEK